MYCIDPDPVFWGNTRTISAISLITIAVVSLGLHGLFIIGVRRLAGWKSSFSFALLISMSMVSITRFLVEIVCDILALAYTDFCANHHLFTTLGSINASAYFTVILLTILMTIHRMIYTICATRASTFLFPSLMKVRK
ncbi:hypothetical protein NECAME_10795 [Necator americanus]|uniref:G-protein coupled receptors family 1 profile domain-containing protein n=1 Tax=Necator americanus TaxID=51031 RepID=W2T708_NECAM|nr:hypothetical protein NECAME_10795 [Necator americanus]ETN77785.1 hypothetical protein NECAME_10795 [Necator americanus]